MMVLFALSSFTSVAFGQTKVSDADLKQNVTPIQGALSTVTRLEPVTYNYNNELLKGVKLPSGTQYGFNADNVQSVLPGVVRTESRLIPAGKGSMKSADIKTVDLQSLVPVLLGAIKEQQQQIDALKVEVQTLRRGGNTAAAIK